MAASLQASCPSSSTSPWGVPLTLLLFLPAAAHAVTPAAARYMDDPAEMFWFLQVSDTHVGEDWYYGSQDTDYLTWVLSASDNVIFPEFIVCTGDLVDATNGYLLPTGQYQDEWDEYNEVLEHRSVTFFHDIPGNHDTYFDDGATYYLGNSLIGTAYGQMHEVWSHAFDFGEYVFVGFNTADTSGAWAGFDAPGIEADELDFLDEALDSYKDANLAFVFSHHPLDYFEYGSEDLEETLFDQRVSVWANGHVHALSQEFDDNTLNFTLASTGKSSGDNLGVFAVDHDGVAVRAVDIGAWPIVLITAPLDVSLGGSNPYAYTVSANHDANPVRALVFDENPPTSVWFSVDGGGAVAMEELEPSVWQGWWDCGGLEEGRHELSVQAESASGTDSHTIEVLLGITECDDGVDNDGNGYVDWDEDGGCYGPSDDDESGWTPSRDTGGADTGIPDSGQHDAPADTAAPDQPGGDSPEESSDGGLKTIFANNEGGCSCGTGPAKAKGNVGLFLFLLGLAGLRARRNRPVRNQAFSPGVNTYRAWRCPSRPCAGPSSPSCTRSLLPRCRR